MHVASGYGLANSILIEGDDGLIVVDTMESMDAAEAVRAAFREISDKPVVAVIYTHNHADHVFGAEAFVDEQTQVYAHDSLMAHVSRVVTELRPTVGRRAQRMFGSQLPDGVFANTGIGPRLRVDENSRFGIVPPTVTFAERLELNIAGRRLELIHAPGETDDQILVWLPDERVLMPGDNIYRAFPNLYTIRGTRYRSPKRWAASIDRMRTLDAEHMIPAHTAPLSGAEAIARVLTDYRDAIRYVHDQTIRWTNAGLGADDVVARVQLPPHLARSAWLQPFYGRVDWSVRGIIGGELGWFDGNPAHLSPLAPAERARRMAALAGGPEALRARFDELTASAQSADDLQWALELSEPLLRLFPDDGELSRTRAALLQRLGERSVNPNARHYYLSEALLLQGRISIEALSNASPEMLARLPMARFFDAIAVNLRAEDCLDIDRQIAFSFPKEDQHWTLWIRRGVAEVLPHLTGAADLHVEMDALVWKQILARQRNAAAAVATDVTMREGSRVDFLRMLALFRN